MGTILDDVLKKLKGQGAGLLSDQEGESLYADTGSPAINWVLSGKFTGGVPLGVVVEFFGNSSTGKTVFVTQTFVGAQKAGYHTVLIDNEHAYHPKFAQGLGLDPEKLIYMEPITVESCFAAIEDTILAIREVDPDTPIFIGFDSIGTAPSDKEMEGEMGGDNMTGAIRAKQTGICLRRVNSFLKKNRATLMIVNQLRTDVGKMFGNKDTKAGGGKSLEYYCSVSNETKVPAKGKLSDDLGNPLGIQGVMKNTKNKHSIPYRDCEFELIYNKGLTRSYGLCDVGLKAGIVEKAKQGWYKFSSEEGDKCYRKADIERMMLDMIDNGELE